MINVKMKHYSPCYHSVSFWNDAIFVGVMELRPGRRSNETAPIFVQIWKPYQRSGVGSEAYIAVAKALQPRGERLTNAVEGTALSAGARAIWVSLLRRGAAELVNHNGLYYMRMICQ